LRLYLAALSLLVITTLFQTACTSYTVPGPAAQMQAFGVVSASEREQLTDHQIKQELSRKPLATFPANLCIARVQGVGYRNWYGNAYGQGAYSVFTARDVENESHFKRLANMPLVAGVAPINRLLLPAELNSDKELRRAAAKLHTQILLVYTFDTNFYNENNASPLDLVTLGFGGHKKIRITSTASAALLDVRNGYLYGVAEATAQHQQNTSSWNNQEKVDESRRIAEAQAFDKLINELATTWSGVIQTYATRPPDAGN
jgi:hypothetical protein